MEVYNAWKNFEKTGSIEKYLEYKSLCNLYKKNKEKEQRVNVDRGSDNKIDKHR